MYHRLSLNLVFLFQLIALGNPTSFPFQSTHLSFSSIALGYFSPLQLLTIQKSQIQPSLEYCSHVWGVVPKSSLHLLDKIQSKAIQTSLILLNLSHRRLVADLCIFCRHFQENCSLEIKNIIPDLARCVRITRNSTQTHPFQVTLPNPRTLAHKSSFIPRTFQLWSSLPPTAFP